MRDACMGYFKLGGVCASGPMNLLAMYPSRLSYESAFCDLMHLSIDSTKAKPWILMAHFFMVALYGTAYAMAPFPSPARVRFPPFLSR